MTDEITRPWSARMGASGLEDRFLPQWGMRLLCLLLCPILPAGVFLGMVGIFRVPVLIIAFVTSVLLGLMGSVLSAYLRIFLISGRVRVDGELVAYTGDKWQTLRLCLKTGVLNFVTLGVYWLIAFEAVDFNKARYSRTTRAGEASNVKRSGFVGNFLHLIIPRVILATVTGLVMFATGLIPLRPHSQLFWNELARPGTRLRPPSMELWELTKAVVRSGVSAFADQTYYNEVTTLIWTAILLFVAYFVLFPWYRHKKLKWEITNTSIDGYRLRYEASYGSYAANSYLNLLLAAIPAVSLVLLFLYRRRIFPALVAALAVLASLALFAALGYISYRMARFRAQNTRVLAPPNPQAPWEVYMISEKELGMTLAQSTRDVFNPKARKRTANYFSRYWTLYALLLVPIVYLIIFRYIPMLYIQMGFKQNNIVIPIWDVSWADNYGFGWLVNAFSTKDFALAMRNTLMLNGFDLLVGFPAPIVLAILLNELAFKRYKRITQTIFYMPHFLSWVIISALAVQLFATSNGMINVVLEQLGSGPLRPFDVNTQWVVMYVLVSVWQGAGWGTIIYLAAITNINPELYEAASVDGANRLSRIWHVTIPGIRPTIIVLLIMRMGGIVGSDFERPFALRNPVVTEVSDVLSIFVYLRGILGTRFSLTTSVGIFQSVICLIFLFSANALAKRYGERGVW
ncbi:MAG: ABC transporter permease subunit [Oscillospiraceae bacterium]|nr:ABC transporter permease subunit [Oscillospiraceae bacterium]